MSEEFEELDFDLDADELDVELDPQPTKTKVPSGGGGGGGKKINLFFQSTIGPSQKQEKLLVSTSAPVGDLKYTVSQIFALEPEDFHLSYLGRTMDPDDVVDNYDCEEGDTILLIPVSTAGKL